MGHPGGSYRSSVAGFATLKRFTYESAITTFKEADGG
jgi:hypothetical protein